jgi:hypothetical protein
MIAMLHRLQDLPEADPEFPRNWVRSVNFDCSFLVAGVCLFAGSCGRRLPLTIGFVLASPKRSCRAPPRAPASMQLSLTLVARPGKLGSFRLQRLLGSSGGTRSGISRKLGSFRQIQRLVQKSLSKIRSARISAPSRSRLGTRGALRARLGWNLLVCTELRAENLKLGSFLPSE